MPLPSGTQLGPYRIVSALGAGGMGEVYRAKDTRLDRDVAVKILSASLSFDQRFRERFEREARVIASLNHPHICTVHDVGEAPSPTPANSGGPTVSYLVMEYLEGETLAERLRRGRPSHETVVTWATQAADALELAHGKGIVHRDLKPGNLFITNSGALKVLDFGLAKIAEAAPDPLGLTMGAMTDVGTAVGTVAYMSPEQARGEAVDARTDVFSLGAVLYEAVTGQPAFPGPTTAVIFEGILSRSVRSMRELSSDTPPEFIALVERMLAKRPADRHPHAGAVASALRDLKKRRDSGPRSGASSRVPSIAVLPFADMSPQKDQDYFCEGMAEELISAFSKLPGLRVASRTSSFRFRGAEDIHKIGRDLGVEAVLEGSVRTAGKRLRVAVQLINAADGYQLWSERYDRQLEDVFDIQDEIARAIVEALKVKLLGDEQQAVVKRQTDNVDAYRLCLKARYHWHRWTADAFEKASALFSEALEIDPNYALAHFGLGDCYTAAATVGLGGPDFRVKARELFEKAIALDPELAEAHAILGIVQGLFEWDWTAADRSLATALALNPRSAHVWSAYACHLIGCGRLDEALQMATRAIELDPLAPLFNVFLSQAYYARREYAKGLKQANTTLELEPTHWFAHAFAGLCQSALGDPIEAVNAFERAVQWSGRLSGPLGYLGFALAKVGRREDAERIVQELQDRSGGLGDTPFALVCVLAGLNQHDQAFAALDRAIAQRDSQLSFHLSYPILDDLHADPRFASVVRRVREPQA